MYFRNLNLIHDEGLLLDELNRLSQPPDLFAPGERLFWDDPHISEQMLAAHLNPDSDAASRKPEVIEQTVTWLMDALGLKPGDSVLDLGCGPGLYAAQLAGRGLNVTGVDYSRRSIDYATRYAAEHDLAITYRCQDYLTLEAYEQYDAVLLIYGDFCVPPPDARDALLDRIWRALKPSGKFVFDVTTRALRAKYGARNRWYVADSGFWKPGPHLVLEQGFDYPEHDIYLDQYVVIDDDGNISVYRNWFHDYSLATITPVLEHGKFTVRAAWSDLCGTPLTDNPDWIGIVADKVL